MGASWLAWVDFILIIILIIILIFITFFGGGLIRGINYLIVDLSPSSTSVELRTGTNVMGISSPTVDQTVVVLANSANRKGLTFKITNSSTTANTMFVEGASNVSINFGPIGNEIDPGESAGFIAINDNNSFLRYE